MATRLIDELEGVREDGRQAGLKGARPEENPYANRSTTAHHHEAWLSGWSSGNAAKTQQEYALHVREERARRRRELTERMTELLGEELFEELTDWTKELIDEAQRR